MTVNHDQSQSYGQNTLPATAAQHDPPAGVFPRLCAAAILLVICSGLAWVALSNPLGHSLIPRCPTEQFLGVYCPGCGSTRATHHLFNARLSEAIAYNPVLVFIGLPIALWYLVRTLLFIIKGRRITLPGIPRMAGYAALALVLAFTTVRNLPVPWAEALRPTAVDEDRQRFEQNQDHKSKDRG